MLHFSCRSLKAAPPSRLFQQAAACDCPSVSSGNYGAHNRGRTGEPHPYQGCALPTELCGPALQKNWSGKRDSNPQPSAWKADALAIELFPLPEGIWWRGEDSNLRRLRQRVYSPSPLATRVPLRMHNYNPAWSWRWESNPQPADYKSAALPLSYASLASPIPQARTARILTL